MKNIFAKAFAFGSALCLALVLTSCGVSITDVSLAGVPATIEKGETYTADPEFIYDGATPESAKAQALIDALELTYSSDNEDVLTVDEDGTLHAVGAGSAELTLTSADGEIMASKTVCVVVTPTKIDIASDLTLSPSNDTAVLEPTVTPEDATDVQVELTSSDESVVLADSDTRKLSAVGAGEAVVTARIAGTDLYAECRVTVLPAVESIDLDQTALTLAPEENAVLTASFTPEDSDLSEVTWAGSDESVATVDADGNVTAVAEGAAQILVTAGEVQASCDVTVRTETAQSSSAKAASGASAAIGAAADTSAASDTSSTAETTSSALHTYWTIVGDTTAFDLQNQLRAEVGAEPLVWDDGLLAIAEERCKQLLEDFSHNGAQTAENIAMGINEFQDASSAIAGWQNSSGHYANMINTGYTRGAIAHIYDGDGCNFWCATFQ